MNFVQNLVQIPSPEDGERDYPDLRVLQHQMKRLLLSYPQQAGCLLHFLPQ